MDNATIAAIAIPASKGTGTTVQADESRYISMGGMAMTFVCIFDFLPIVKHGGEKTHGEFRTKHLCLEAYDYFAKETLLRQ